MDPAQVLVALVFAVSAAAVVAITASGLTQDWRRWRSHRRDRPIALRVTRRDALSSDTFALTLQPRWGRLPQFAAGQHIVLQIPCDRGRPVLRAYSLAAWEARPQRYLLGVKREADGLVSRWLFDHAHPGCHIRASRPKGAFHNLDIGPSAEIVLVAGGIGITPLRAMLQHWTRSGGPARVTLHFSARAEADLYYHPEFLSLAAAADWFDYRPRLTGPAPGWTGATGRLTAAHVVSGVSDVDRTQIFLCAGGAMETAIAEGLQAAGLAASQIRRERFGVQAAANDIQASITCDGRNFAYAGAPTLLHALEANGIALPAECRAGECGRCRLAIVEGAARDLLTGDEATDSVLTCCAVPKTDIVLRRLADS